MCSNGATLYMKRAFMATSAAVFPSRAKTPSNDDASNDNDGGASRWSPTLPIHIFRPNDYMEIAFDSRTRTPLYVMERLEGGRDYDNESTSKRRARFYEEATLPVEFRSRNGHYRGSGYDRGHLIPAADFKHDSVAAKDTYSLCNTIPQVSSMNRHGWAQVEAFVRNVAEREWNERKATTIVITGPLWLPASVSKENPNVFQYAHHGIGTPPWLIQVPTHLYKIVAVVKGETIFKFAAFVMPNTEMKRGRFDLSQFLVRLTDLEAVCGMHFFAGMQDFRQHADALTEETLSRVQGRSSLLMIEGDPTGAKRKSQDLAVDQMSKLRHLCERGKCQ